jgi:succinate-acetate transporter protein
VKHDRNRVVRRPSVSARLDDSRWFNAVWALGYWTLFTAASVVAAIETSRMVRFLFSALAAAFGLVLLYTVCALTVLGPPLDRALSKTSKDVGRKPR